jgi:short-subunit dehydrogenase
MDKVIIITGASSGFGKTTAELLSSHGHKVYGFCRREMSHPSITYVQCDVRDSETIALKVKEIYDKEGCIDVLINNAGMGIGGSLEMAAEEEIDTQMNVNFRGCVNMCQKVLPYMRKQRQGKIINFSSIGGVMGLPYQGFYSASKFAIEGFTEALSAEVKGFGIQLSMVEPGDFATNFTASRKNSQSTMDDPDYGPIFKRSLGLIEKEENGGLTPDVLARKIEKIVNAKHPRLRYVVANFEQWLSVVLKRIIPGNWFVNILVDYYKTKPEKK